MTPEEIQAAVQAQLPPGFDLSNAKFETDKRGLWLSLQFSFCGLDRWCAVAWESEDIALPPALIDDLVAQIMLQPIIEFIEVYPFGETVRCIQRLLAKAA